MSNENKQKAPRKKNKKTSQATVLKQLNDQSLFPLRERIGIYVIATLSVIGLVLISYTGVMAFVNTVNTGPTTADVDVNLDDVDTMLDDLGEILDALEDDEDPTQDEADLHEYVDPTDPDEEVETEPEATEPEETEPEPTEPETEAPATATPTRGTISVNISYIRRTPGPNGDILGNLVDGDRVRIVDYDSNPYWIAIEGNNEFNISPVFIDRNHITTD